MSHHHTRPAQTQQRPAYDIDGSIGSGSSSIKIPPGSKALVRLARARPLRSARLRFARGLLRGTPVLSRPVAAIIVPSARSSPGDAGVALIASRRSRWPTERAWWLPRRWGWTTPMHASAATADGDDVRTGDREPRARDSAETRATSPGTSRHDDGDRDDVLG